MGLNLLNSMPETYSGYETRGKVYGKQGSSKSKGSSFDKKICSKMAALNIFFQKVPEFEIWHPFANSKPVATPTFCEQKFSRMHHFGIMNFLSFFSTIGDQRFA